MKNIHLIPTDKPSRLVKIKDNLFYTTTENIPGGVYQHIYITNSEGIKEGDWYYFLKRVLKFKSFPQDGDRVPKNSDGSFKIILTTDQDLIADGVQAIDDDFLEWFCNNSSCEEIDVKYKYWKEINDIGKYTYKIIIPKDEPKQGTLEEASERVAKLKYGPTIYGLERVNAFKDGVKWQEERMYSEEDMKLSFDAGLRKAHLSKKHSECWKEWFEQFKK